MADRRYVYVLYDPVDGKARYVGVTGNPKILNKHPYQWALSPGNPQKNAWIKGLVALGLRPAYLIYEDVVPRRAPELRKAWIDKLKRLGAPIFNLDKSTKNRDASLCLWKDPDFRLKAKEGRDRREKERMANLLKRVEELPGYSDFKYNPLYEITVPYRRRFKTAKEIWALNQRQINRIEKRLFDWPPMTAFK